ncbi:hypothetical protein ACNE9Y_30050 [Pseudomonas sp. NY11226]|uniref:hypothetical protein n=1 Tax=unclassified Pseudomonas TaxID=196821 RepID=UPI0006D3BB2D|nr:hypothetical protein [Pseudomonas sp. NBRC 111118]
MKIKDTTTLKAIVTIITIIAAGLSASFATTLFMNMHLDMTSQVIGYGSITTYYIGLIVALMKIKTTSNHPQLEFEFSNRQ